MTRPALEKAFSFRKKIIVLFFVLIIVPFVFFAYYSYNKSLEGISKANASFSLDYLLQSRNNFDDYLRKINGSINDIIGTDKLQEMLKRVPKNVEEDRQFTLDMINFIYQEKQRVDAARIRIYPATLAKFPDFIDSLDDGRGITDERWFKEEMKSGRPTWSLFTAQDNAIIFPFPIITLTKKFTSLNNEIPLGIIAADIDEDRIQRFIAVPQVRLGQEAFLLNEDGVVLSHPDKQLIGKTISSPELINLIQTKEQGTSTIQINHTDMLVTYVKLSELPGTIVSAIPLSILTESLKEIQRLTLYFLIGYILSCIGVIIYITFYFSNAGFESGG
jgi:two-component system sensor histidine kinase YesM